MSAPGHLVAGRYRLVNLVGTGGMGAVWEAWDERLQRRVAVKQLRLPPELTNHEAELASQRAMREARITARLHHPNAISVFDVVDEDGRPCLIMQFVPSMTLAEVLKEGGPLHPHEAAQVGAQVAAALTAAHELGIVHRDVKPGNILIADDGTALLSDFGISRALDDLTLTTTGMVHGTPAYLAPEVARGEQATFASDLFCLGATLYAALEGSPPFGTDTNAIALLHRVAAGTFEPPRRSGPLTPVLLQLLSEDPAARPPMYAAARMLEELASGGSASPTTAEGEPSESKDSSEPDAPTATPTPTEVADTPRRPEAVGTPNESPAIGTPNDPAAVLPAAEPAAVRTAADPAAVPTPAEPDAEPVAAQPRQSTASAGRGGGSPRPSRRRRRAAWVAVLVAALAAAGIGAAFLLPLLDRQDAPNAAQPPGTATSSADSTPTTSSGPTPSSAAPSSAPPSAEDSSSASSKPSGSDSSSPPERPSRSQQLKDAITGYYALVPSDTDGAWSRMTDEYKAERSGGREGYEAFWADIERVETRNVTADPPDRAEATLTYYFKDGRVVDEQTEYRLEKQDGTMKIDRSEVISSTTR